MSTTTTTNVPHPINEYYNRALLFRATPMLHYEKVAQRKELPQRNGKTMVFRRVESLPIVTAPLLEGRPGNAAPITVTPVTTTILPYGTFIECTDFHKLTVDDPTLNEYTAIMGENAGQTMDQLTRDRAVAGSNIAYGGGVSAVASLATRTHMIDSTILDRVVRALKNNNAKPFMPQINAGMKVATLPIGMSFWGICHPDISFTIRYLPGFVDVKQYSMGTSVAMGEIGYYGGIRFMETTHAPVLASGGGATGGADVKSTDTTNADVYTTMVFAKNALGVVPLAGNSLKNIMKKLGSAGAADPLDQISTVAWKHFGNRVILNDAFMYRILSTAGELAP